MAEPIRGSCLCGAVRFTIDAPVNELRACHCRNCQKASGAGGSVNAVVPRASFHRGECGSPVYSQRETTPETVVVRAGLFDNAGEMKIAAHIWTRSGTRSARPWSYIEMTAG